MSRIAIMQGRLVPPEAGRFQCFPRQSWRAEFPRASAAHLDAIEWIYDQYGEDLNPLGSAEGVQEIKSLSKQHGISVASICADYFMDRPIVRASPRELIQIVDRLEWLLRRGYAAGIERIVLPFVDQSRIENREDMDRVVEVLNGLMPGAVANAIEIHLETSLAPGAFAALIDRVPHESLKVNYDSGNSSSLGYHPREEFAAYGPRIGSVHVKDRTLGGSTVSLGTGDTDLPTVFRELGRIGYQGDFVLQVTRGDSGDEVNWAKQNREYLLALVAGSPELARSES